ncbi:MAG TPA: hypothetical protein VF795_02185 [Desulfuromonadaceae bacterium]
MKCPKCGFNSFEYHDVCKKCAHDLTGYKLTHGIQALVLPREARKALAPAHAEETTEAAPTPAEAVADMFSFDLPEADAAVPEPPAAPEVNPFDFGEEPAIPESRSLFDDSPDEEQMSAQAQAEEDAFASLLESAGQGDATATTAAPPADTAGDFDLENFSWDDTPPPAAQPESSSPQEADAGSFGEFDLENFSWEETPAAPAGTETTAGSAADFGGTDEATAKK